jgi:hypothetical protein
MKQIVLAMMLAIVALPALAQQRNHVRLWRARNARRWMADRQARERRPRWRSAVALQTDDGGQRERSCRVVVRRVLVYEHCARALMTA